MSNEKYKRHVRFTNGAVLPLDDDINVAMGPYTGRCALCGSNDLWDDATCYGCNNCGAMYQQ